MGAGAVDQMRVEAVGDVAADPVEIVGGEAGAGDEVEPVVAEPRHGQVALDAAPVD